MNTQVPSPTPTTINGTDFVPAFNGTLVNQDNCTPQICSLEYAQLFYIPDLASNLAYLVIFAILLFIHLVLGPFYRTWGFLVGIVGGLLLEIIGYIGRLLLHGNVFSFNAFVIYLVCLTIAPAFLTASIYLCLSHFVIAYGQDIARFAPRTYTFLFICADIISLVLQAVGGAISATSDSGSDSGVNILIGGLAFQVASLTIFMILGIDLIIAYRRADQSRFSPAFANLRSKVQFRLFPWAIALATVTIFVRSCFRVAELKDGFNGSVANNQTLFTIFEGPMIIVAVVALTLLHPGFCFGGREGWKATTWTWKAHSGKVLSQSDEDSLHLKGVRSSTQLQYEMVPRENV